MPYTIFPISGNSGSNYTGVSQGGLAATASHYIAAYNSVNQSNHGQQPFERNAILALMPRSNPQSGSATHLPLTAFSTGEGKTASAPQLVPLSEGRVAVLWEVFRLDASRRTSYAHTQYLVLDAMSTPLGSVQSCNLRISTTYPAVYLNGQLFAPNPFFQQANRQNHIYINRFDLSMFM